MNKLSLYTLLITFLFSSVFAQSISDLKLREGSMNISNITFDNTYKVKNYFESKKQVPTRKTVNMYFGAGYSFVIFTNSVMNAGYPVLDTRSGDFLSEVNLFFGFALAKAVALEFEPSILFTRNSNYKRLDLTTPVNINGYNYNYDYPNQSMLAFPLTVNARFFPFFKLPGFMRLFFIGGGAGTIWVHEDNDHAFSNNAYFQGYGYEYYLSSSTGQWAPLFRVMTGFTGVAGMFGYGGEIRFNYIPLKDNGEPFRTRIAKNFNSVDIALRFYFGM